LRRRYHVAECLGFLRTRCCMLLAPPGAGSSSPFDCLPEKVTPPHRPHDDETGGRSLRNSFFPPTQKPSERSFFLNGVWRAGSPCLRAALSSGRLLLFPFVHMPPARLFSTSSVSRHAWSTSTATGPCFFLRSFLAVSIAGRAVAVSYGISRSFRSGEGPREFQGRHRAQVYPFKFSPDRACYSAQVPV